MSYTEEDRVIALAGIFQSARMVTDLAHDGRTDTSAYDASLLSLFDLNPPSVSGVFGSQAGVQLGLHTLWTQLERPRERDMEITRYVISIIQLCDKLLKDSRTLNQITDAIDNLADRTKAFEFSQQAQTAQLAETYSQFVSPIQPKIIVKGDGRNLQNTDTAAMIRASLLAGIRAAVLWRQTGGKRWQLLLNRKKIAQLANQLKTVI